MLVAIVTYVILFLFLKNLPKNQRQKYTLVIVLFVLGLLFTIFIPLVMQYRMSTPELAADPNSMDQLMDKIAVVGLFGISLMCVSFAIIGADIATALFGKKAAVLGAFLGPIIGLLMFISTISGSGQRGGRRR